ncbi:MAG: efflux RND transporter permease subunit [Planctomycetota bacterium]|nr:efflux RND transporter permease subunit [Planctomycetota bacterium]
MVRNAILLIEFILDSLKGGLELKEALLQSGAVRFRPILLTASSAALGAWPIKGLAQFFGSCVGSYLRAYRFHFLHPAGRSGPVLHAICRRYRQAS